MYKYKYTGDRNGIKTKGGVTIAEDFTRIVHGGRGAYVEFDPKKLRLDTMFLNNFHYYFDEYRTNEENIMVYFQTHTVDYADYIVGKVYISPVYLQDFERDGRYEGA